MSTTAASTRPANYKQVTVLFADVVRSMDIAATVDLEPLREIMTQLVERSAGVILRYGGTVEHTGDGVMALFGAPVALEDHAHRACLAALGIQQEVNRLATEVMARHGVTLQVRIGLNSGLVIAGEIGSGSLGYAATGETVGFAQRMESAAAPGGITLSESTARLVEQSATLGQPEWVRIKGIASSRCGPTDSTRCALGASPSFGSCARAAGDKASSAMAMTGPATTLLYTGRSREGARLASEQMALLDSIGDPAPTMGLAFVAFANWCDSGEAGQILHWSQIVIDLADGDPTKGGTFGMGSPKPRSNV